VSTLSEFVWVGLVGVLCSVTNDVGEGETVVVLLRIMGLMLMGKIGDALGEMCWDIRSPSSVASR
jgi:hypothetical protein